MVSGQISDLSRAILPLHTALSVAVPGDIDTDRLRAIRKDIAAISDTLHNLYLS